MSEKNKIILVVEVYQKDTGNKEYLLCSYNERTRALCKYIAESGRHDKVIVRVHEAYDFFKEGIDFSELTRDDVVFIKKVFDKMISTNNFDFKYVDEWEFYNNRFEKYFEYILEKNAFRKKY